MLRSTGAPLSYPRRDSLARLWRHSRAVEVDVFDWGLLVDSFQTADPTVLKEAVLAVYRHPSETRGSVRLRGIDESALPFGLGRQYRQVALDDLTKAVCFLEG